MVTSRVVVCGEEASSDRWRGPEDDEVKLSDAVCKWRGGGAAVYRSS